MVKIKNLNAMKIAFVSFALASATLFASCTTGKFDEAGTVDDGAVRAQQYSLDSMKFEMAKQDIVDSMAEVARVEREAALEEQAAAYAATRSTSRSTGSANTRAASSASNYSNTSYAGSASQPVYTAPEKRGWSAKAKGAVIGAGTGAVSGAVINKRDRAKGAIIGGVLGAGAGTGVGAIIDKKNGR